MSTEEGIVTDPNPIKKETKQNMGKLYRDSVSLIFSNKPVKRPSICGWFIRKVKKVACRKELHISDDENVDIILDGDHEFKGTWGEAKKWLDKG